MRIGPRGNPARRTADYLRDQFSSSHWRRLDESIAALRRHFAEERFADLAEFGALLVPDPAKLDTRTRLDPAVRRDQLGTAREDFLDERLPAGAAPIPPGTDWTLVAAIIGTAGIHFGSDEDIRNGDAERYTVSGVNTRSLMVRQIWGARVLQAGDRLPDCEVGGDWTFTLMPGEDRVDGKAVSGTVLHGKVRFRLGKTNRGIAVARACPALVVQ